MRDDAMMCDIDGEYKVFRDEDEDEGKCLVHI